jgi:hypothetical protein
VSRFDRSSDGIPGAVFFSPADGWQVTSIRGKNIERMLAQCYPRRKKKEKKDELVYKTEMQPFVCPCVSGTLRLHFDSPTILRVLGRVNENPYSSFLTYRAESVEV